LIDRIIESSKSRGFRRYSWQLRNRRDLIKSARALKAVGIIPIIAEIKPLTLGRPMNKQEVIEYARIYEANNACAISVLTEPSYFMGSIENLKIVRETAALPVLRKDFIFDKRQIEEIQADLVLLIASLNIEIDAFVEKAFAMGMEPLVEVHDEKELDSVLKTDAKIVGINNRNLGTLQVDLGTFEKLAFLTKDAGVFLVAESGLYNKADVLRMLDAGADAVLIGTALMEHPDSLSELNR
jgi:indole-3-glycerol phosphate synthase